ncbi:hypothetical protein M514_23294 [Trichuris suis]|uniref:Uncharacterized protein n=1 Tax=Trichuris suis TaxID=68888 RepID=A0A085N4Q1_9BILA|nr:hypothetical protein M514_23294 [Trichuris suis]
MHSMSKDGQYGHSCQDLIVSPQEASPCACFGCRAEEEFKRFSGATFNFLNHEYSVSQVDKSSMPRQRLFRPDPANNMHKQAQKPTVSMVAKLAPLPPWTV